MFGLPGIALLTAGIALEHREGGMPKVRPLALLGDASYSIYLWHTLALAVLVKIGKAAHAPTLAVLPAAVVGATAVGVATFWVIERPLQRLLKRPKRIHGVPVPAGL